MKSGQILMEIAAILTFVTGTLHLPLDYDVRATSQLQ